MIIKDTTDETNANEKYITVTGKHSVPPEEFNKILDSAPMVDLRTTRAVPKPLR